MPVWQSALPFYWFGHSSFDSSFENTEDLGNGLISTRFGLISPVAHQPVLHVGWFCLLWLEIFAYKSHGSSAIFLDWGGMVWVAHFNEQVPYWYGFTGVYKQTSNFGIRRWWQYIFQNLSNVEYCSVVGWVYWVVGAKEMSAKAASLFFCSVRYEAEMM